MTEAIKTCRICDEVKTILQFRPNRNICKKCEAKGLTIKDKITMKKEPVKKMTATNLPDGFYQIIDGMAIPAKQRKSLIETKYAFLKTMEVSTTKCAKFTDKKIWSSALMAANNYGKKANKTFAGRVLPDGDAFGIWRIK